MIAKSSKFCPPTIFPLSIPVLYLTQSNDVIGYQIKGADYVSQCNYEDNNRFSWYVPVISFPVIFNERYQQFEILKKAGQKADFDNILFAIF